MNDNFIDHIKNKLFEKDEIYDRFDIPSREVIRYLMITTFNVIEDECQSCYFCQNYNRFSVFSRCKIKSHTKRNCYHFRMNARKILKKKYYRILIRASEATHGMHIKFECCPSKTKKNIIYESIRLFEAARLKNEIAQQGSE